MTLFTLCQTVPPAFVLNNFISGNFVRINSNIPNIPVQLLVKVTLWSFWSRHLGGHFLLDYSVTYLLSCFVLCCTCLMFDCVRKVVGKLVCHIQSKHISTVFAKFLISLAMLASLL